ncbi:acyl-CoA synthetase [Cupriavidus basilensis OR16]|uniref:Acyl-CoA synthetase n=1 Tax=Cupriavidus basilensis OR16 TaxID=1127483 RepID=H1S745_9BURK|nr:AMP-binding protein [Cupriavidus basilensis]EHP41856.1 acyl-CoA synthetase [Cupriavidus basilensis OR16]
MSQALTSQVDSDYFKQLDQLQQQHWPSAVPRQASWPHGEIALTEYLRAWARVRPTHPAVIFYGTELTYAELNRLSDRFAALLHRHGVRAGERVAVMLGNCPQFHIAFYGILKLGAVHVPVNPLFKERELIHELNDAGAATILVLDQLAPLLQSVQPRTPVRTVFVTGYRDLLPESPTLPLPPGIDTPRTVPAGTIDLMPALSACDAPTPVAMPDLDAMAALNYTGGTTGMPKGCMHTQRDMVYTAATGCTMSGALAPDGCGAVLDDVSLNFMSMFWIAGENIGLVYPIFAGGTLVLLARWDPLGVMAAIERYQVRRTVMLVDNAAELMDHPDVARYNLRSLRATRVSSFVKKVNPAVRRRWLELTGSVMAEGAWGMTETHTSDTFTTGMQDDDMDLKGQPVFVGLPMPGTRIKICDFENGVPLPLGQEGEIVVRTPSLFKGYWNKPEASAEAIRDGWFHTGDIGVYDAQGYLHFLGRRKEMLKVKGMSVFPAEIEALLGQHPAVVGSGVIGRDDAERGQVPVAFVRLHPHAEGSLSADELAQWCKQNMATYKVPEIRFVQQLPMTATGKVKKHELAQFLA